MSLDESSSDITNWAKILFVDHPYLYLPVLEAIKEDARHENDALCKIFKNFSIANGTKLLDFSCGIGRHSIGLAIRGYEVVGYDPSQLFIETAKLHARKEISKQDRDIRFYNGDINHFKKIMIVNHESDFNFIIIMFTSIGYISEAEDYKIFEQLYSLASPGCLLIIQTENRDWRIMNTPNHCIYEFEEILIKEVWKFDQNTSIATSRSKYFLKDPQKNSYHLHLELQVRIRLYSLHELLGLLYAAGWKHLKTYGDLVRLDDVTLTSQNLIIVCRK
jgi:2-polyprenyl-3-methyl-5-hydroxy-6-metoxy-1,4-benzoquinol methylase